MPTIAEARQLALKTPKKTRQRKNRTVAVELVAEEAQQVPDRSAEDTIAAALHEEEEACRADERATKRRKRDHQQVVTGPQL